MDIQRLLSVLKVIHTSILDLTARIETVEGALETLTEQLSVEFEVGESDDDEEESGEESDESDTSAQSAPASFQHS